MLLVFFSLFILSIIIYIVLKIKIIIEFKDVVLEYYNFKKVSENFNINIFLKLNKFKILILKFNTKKIKKIIQTNKQKYRELYINKKELFKLLNKTKIYLEKLDLNVNIGIENPILTSRNSSNYWKYNTNNY